MGVYIKGMKMPKACLACPCFDEKDYVCKAIIKMLKKESIYHCRPDWCPLVAVPHHGRLIDMDGEIVVKTTIMRGEDCNVDLSAPVIMPAEEGE